MVKIEIGQSKPVPKKGRYGLFSSAYGFPFEERPVFQDGINLKNVLTIASGGGIPMLMLLEKGAERIDVVDISLRSIGLAMFRLFAALSGRHKEFSELLMEKKVDELVIRYMKDNFPNLFVEMQLLGINIEDAVSTSILPLHRPPPYYFREYNLPDNAVITFMLADVCDIVPSDYTTIFLSNVMSYYASNMFNFFSHINDKAYVIYTIAGAHTGTGFPKTFLFRGREFKEKFLPYAQP